MTKTCRSTYVDYGRRVRLVTLDYKDDGLVLCYSLGKVTAFVLLPGHNRDEAGAGGRGPCPGLTVVMATTDNNL